MTNDGRVFVETSGNVAFDSGCNVFDAVVEKLRDGLKSGGNTSICLIAMNENRVRFEGEERIAELEAQLRECRKSSEVAIAVEAQTLKREMAWRDWAQQVIGVALVDPEASRAHIDKLIAKLEAQLKVVETEALEAVKDEDVPESGLTYRGAADSWLRVSAAPAYLGGEDSWLRPRTDMGRVAEELKKPPLIPYPLTDEEIRFVRDAFQASKQTPPYVCKP